MKSSYSVSNDVLVLDLEPDDLKEQLFNAKCLKLIHKLSLNYVVINMSKFITVQKEDIQKLENFSKFLNINNIKNMVCGIDLNSILVLMHFMEDFKFNSTLDVQRALDDIKN